MAISEETLESLEFFKALNLVARHCMSEPGAEYVRATRPLGTMEAARREGGATNEAREILINGGEPPIEGVLDVRESLRSSLVEGAALQPKQALEILATAAAARRLKRFLRSQREIAPDLSEEAEALFDDKLFENRIDRVVDENGMVRDSASKKLREIRDDIDARQRDLRRMVEKIMKRLSDEDFAREDYTTLREGRVVVPVKAEHKRHIKGFIHSESSTGRTVYIEPEETLNLNNEIVSLRFAEKREIERLMRELTASIGAESDALLQSYHAYVRLDAVFARGKYAIESIGEALALEEEGGIALKDARHPLLLARLGREKTEPLSVEMNEDRVLVISGPNAGGKTVAMKSVGLISAMTAAGLPAPADPDSRLPFFEQIHIVVGDEQSIENDLSAFSSHLARIKRILERADERTLALLDEIGASTDPVAGAAIAATVLTELRDRGAFVVSTTHHRALKTLAAETEGFENASMEFDPDELAPTYRFAQGLPGSSYAFEIASRIGLSDQFVERARSRVAEDQDRVESLLADVERKSAALRDRLRDVERENTRLKGLADLYEKKAKKLDAEKREILKGAKREAQELVERANKSIERVVKEIRESGASKASIKQARNEMATTMRVAEETAPDAPIETDEAFEPRVGAYAAIAGSGVVGEIVEVDENKQTATVAAGDLKLRAPFKNLTGAKRREAKKSEKARTAATATVALDAPSYRLDLRGKRVEETTFDVERFLDDAHASGLERVEILHGKGTGALRRAVHDMLKERRDVADFRSAPIEHGGDGITIVVMK